MKTKKYNTAMVTGFFNSYGIPTPEYEWRFHDERKWRFDIAWRDSEYRHTTHFEKPYVERPLALEVQGGIWIAGRHSRGASLLKEWEKLNEAAILGWRILYCQPDDLLTKATAETIKRALGL